MNAMRYFTPIILLIVTVKFSSCAWPNYDVDPIEAGLETNVKGVAYDFNLNRPEVGCTVYAVESLLDQEVRYRYVDSTLTDSLGNYSLQFTTSGEGYGYGAQIKLSDGKQFFRREYAHQTQVYAGSVNTVDFHFARTSVMKVDIKVTDNPYPLLKCQAQYDHNYFEILGEDAVTTLFIPVVPNVENALHFYAISYDSIPRYMIEKTDTINLTGHSEDTVFFDLELHPSTFLGRYLNN